MKPKRESFSLWELLLFSVVTLAVMCMCVCLGSVSVSLPDTVEVLKCAVSGRPVPDGLPGAIIISVRIPRVLCAALSGAALSISGAAMQGLLKNPLADGSTLGVSSGAALGAVCAIAFGVVFQGLPFAGTMTAAIIFAFLSLLLILAFAYRLDRSLSTNTIILIGVIFSMFASSLMSLIISFSAEKLQSITFWTMGSFQSTSYSNAGVLAAALLICGTLLLMRSRELNAFAVGEDNARNIGVDVRKVKLLILINVSVLVGVCVSIGGCIGFVGLVTPHIVRLISGPNHKRLLPASAFGGAVFLLLADLAARTVISPRQLPVGVVTSLVGAVVFAAVLFRSGRR